MSILALAMIASTALNGSQPLRGVVYFLLLAQPFAIICALLLDPPSVAQRRLLTRVCVSLVAIQIPLAYAQASVYGRGDSVTGSLTGTGAGAHVMAAIVIVGTFWYLGHTRSPLSPISIGILASMVGILLLADAKQIILALPVAIIAQRALSARTVMVGLIALISVAALVRFEALNGGYAIPYIDRALSGETGKVHVAQMIWEDAKGDIGSFLFGQGPAETVSRTAYGTVPAYQKSGSSFDILGLEPAKVPYEAELIAAAAVRATGNSAFNEPFNLDSFDSGTSSGVGLFGDLGIFGFLAYTGFFGTVFMTLRRRRSPEALAAASGFAMLAFLGFILDWWEQPPFTVFLASLAALALTRPESPVPPAPAS